MQFRLQFRLLGPVSVWEGDRRVDLGRAESAKARCVLAALLRDPGELVSSETLADRVWGGDPPGPAVRYKYVGWLRAALAPYGVRLVFRDDGYVIDVRPSQVDLHRFRCLVTRARADHGAGRHEQAAALLRDALCLWHGTALAGLPGRWAALFRDQLAEERVAAAALRARAELELGRHAEVVSELAEMHTERPADETIAGLLMLALHRAGHRSRALGCYRRTEQEIRTGLGAQPGPELRELQQRIQAGDPGLLPADVVIGGPGPGEDAADGEQRPVRVVIAEDSAALRESMAWLLRARGHQVAATVTGARALGAAVRQHRPDVVVADVRLPPTYSDEGLRAAVTLRREHPGLGVLVVSQYLETRFVAELLAGPARGIGYLLKDRVADAGEFIDALLRVARGGIALDPEVVRRLLTRGRHASQLAALAGPERDVLALVAEGRSTAAIARALSVPAEKVADRMNSAARKLGLPPCPEGRRRYPALLRYLRP